MQYDNTDTIVIFKNDKKGNEKAPDYTGKLFDADGKERRVALWLRDGKSGNKFMSGKVEDLREQAQHPQQLAPSYAEPVTASKTAFDDVPF